MSDYLFIAFLIAGVAGATAARKLTLPAAITGGLVAIIIYVGVGWISVVLMAVFFLLGTIATSWQKKYKQQAGVAHEGETKRTIGQVLANGGVAGLLALCALLFPSLKEMFVLLTAAAFSSATSDTVSSELGNVYGRRFYDILSFQKGKRGENGVVSLEGTAYGILGSCLIAAVYALHTGWNLHYFTIIVAGTVGNLADSILGATLERKQVLGNNAVNFLNTLVAALIAYLLLQF